MLYIQIKNGMIGSLTDAGSVLEQLSFFSFFYFTFSYKKCVCGVVVNEESFGNMS